MSLRRILPEGRRTVAMALAVISLSLVVSPALMPATDATAAFDPSWTLRRAITVSNSGALLTDHQVMIQLDSAFDFTKAEPDGSDLRVTDTDGETEIPFWIESWDPVGETAVIWAKVPSAPTGDTDIFLYYGNTGATSTADGETTFEFFDDFSSAGGPGPGKVVIDNALNGSHNLMVEDIDGDSKLDLVVAAYRAEVIVWYQHPPDPVNDPWVKFTVDPLLENAHDVKIGDIDGDGRRDFVGLSLSATWENYGASPGYVAWYQKPLDPLTEPWTKTIIASHGLLVGARSSYVEDIDSDGDMDIAVAVDGGQRLYWYQNPGGVDALTPALWNEYLIDTGAANGADVVIGDVDGDGNPDIVYAGTTGTFASVLVYYAPDDPTDVVSWTRVPLFGDAYGVHLVDFDGDGNLDILRASAHSDLVSWLENPQPADPRVAGNWNEYIIEQNAGIHVANRVWARDVDGDGDLDIGMDADPSGGSGTFKWYRRPADPTDVASYEIYVIDDDPNYTAYAHDSYPADVDLDGDIDVVGVGPNAQGGTVMWWLNDGSPTGNPFAAQPKWTNIGATIAGGILTVTGSANYLASGPTFQYTAMRTRAQFENYVGYGAMGYNTGTPSVGTNDAMFVTWVGDVRTITSTSGFNFGYTGLPGNDWKVWDIRRQPTEIGFDIDGTLAFNHTANISADPLSVQFHVYSGGPAAIVKSDWVLVRAYSTPEPTTLAGAEEAIGAATMGPNSVATLCLSTVNACSSVPFEITRPNATDARGFSLTFALSPELSLCDGLNSVSEGNFLSDAGATQFQTVDNLDGTYTVDCVILGATCGATALTGTLFTVDVTNAVPDGTGTLSVNSTKLRDCSNADLPSEAGPAASVQIDSTAPAAIADLAAAPVETGSPPGAESNTAAVRVSWTAPIEGDAASILLYRKALGDYPEYSDAGALEPPVPSDPIGEGWSAVATLAAVATSYDDTPSGRDYWYYVAFVADACGNVSAGPVQMTRGALNYLLGDASDGLDPDMNGIPGDGDNRVWTEDISFLGNNYGISLVPDDPMNTLDIGPTDDLSVSGLPTTDNQIEFEDLILFGINYGSDYTIPKQAPAVATAPPPSLHNTLFLEAPALPEVGETFPVDLQMTGDGRIQGLSAALAWNPEVVEPVAMGPGELLEAQGGRGLVLSPRPGAVDAALLGVREFGISGAGRLATVTFRVLASGRPELSIERVSARDHANQTISMEVAIGAPDLVPLPSKTSLHRAAPNPFNPRTTIAFDLAQPGPVSLTIYDVGGRRIKTLANGFYAPGRYFEDWDGSDRSGKRVASGTYVVRLQTASGVQTRRLVLVK